MRLIAPTNACAPPVHRGGGTCEPNRAWGAPANQILDPIASATLALRGAAAAAAVCHEGPQLATHVLLLGGDGPQGHPLVKGDADDRPAVVLQQAVPEDCVRERPEWGPRLKVHGAIHLDHDPLVRMLAHH